jgi:hypothetical protein
LNLLIIVWRCWRQAAVENHPSVRTSIFLKKAQKEILEKLRIEIKS